MDIHKPKLPHGLREFLKEIGTIVIGVLLALGAEQIVESLNWRHKIDQAKTAMGLELVEDDAPQAYARVVSVGCFDGQLDQVEALINHNADRADVRRAARAYQPPYRTWDSEAWQTTIASDVGTHMAAGELVKWSGPYRNLPAMERRSDNEQHDRDELSSIRDQSGPLANAEAERLLALIALLRADNVWNGIQGQIFMEQLRPLHLDLGPAVRARVLREAQARFGACAAERASPSGGKQLPTVAYLRSWIGLPTRD